MSEYNDVVEKILEEINCTSRTEDQTLIDAANELAAGVTAEQEASIAESLPRPYTSLVNARAEISDDKLLVPRQVLATAARPAGEEWRTSTQGRRRWAPKQDAAVGVHVDYESEHLTILRLIILWRRDKD